MKRVSATINKIRANFGIPGDGFSGQAEALAWYKKHFIENKGVEFRGSFGFRYDPYRRILEFDYEIKANGLFIALATPLDPEVPFDQEISTLTSELNIPEPLSPAARLIVLMGKTQYYDQIPEIPNWLIASLGGFKVLLYQDESNTWKEWRKMGQLLGVLPSEDIKWDSKGIIQGYDDHGKWTERDRLYWESLQANIKSIRIRQQQGKKGKKGILKDTARILIENYGWKDCDVANYKISRYVKRAKQRWLINEDEEI